MPIAVTTWDEVDQDNYDAARAVLAEIVVERHPEVETRGGTISDLVLTLQGVLSAAGRIERQRLLESNSVLQAIQNPNLVDSATLDDLFSNYFVTRENGGFASGQVTISLSQPTPTVIPQGFVFSAGTRDFITTNSFAARLTEADVLSDTDRVLTKQPDGTYTFLVDVKAAVIGSASTLRQGDVVTLSKPVANVLQAFATNDFTGGADPEANSDLVARLELGIAAKTWSNSTNVAALVRKQPGFADARVSVCGAGAPEMLRDKHSLFPIAYGNRVDIYVKTLSQPTVTTVTLPATYIGNGLNGPIWQIAIGRDDMPAVYAVTRLRRGSRVASAVVAPTTVAGQYTAAAGDPDIVTPIEAAFSRFQSLLVTFTDAADPSDTLVANVTQVDYFVTGTALMNISDLQAALTAPALKALAGDVVVRAAVPCLVSLEVDFDRITDAVPTTTIASALADYVNKSDFNGAIYTSRIMSIVSSFLPSGVNLQRVRISGIVLGPDGSKRLFRSFEFLAAPYDPANMITPATVAFYLDPSDIAFNAIAQ